MLKLQDQSRLIIVGPSQSGKTNLCYKIIKNKLSLFESPINKVIYLYKKWQPMYDKILEMDPSVLFIEGYPTNLNEMYLSDVNQQKMVICDDMDIDVCSSPKYLEDFTVNSHHYNYVILLCSHAIYLPSKFSRTIQMSATGFILFKNPRDVGTIANFSRQIYPEKNQYKKVIQWYKYCTDTPFGYLFINLSPRCPEILRFRSDIFKNFGEMLTFIM